jgi:hypothetical protein
MNRVAVSGLLRLALAIDAVASAATGLVMSLFASPLSIALQLPQGLLLGAGLFCLLYAALLALMTRPSQLPRAALWAVVVGNLGWVGGCVWLAFGGLFAPNTLGIGFLLLQATAVAGFAELQYVGLRRATAAHGAWRSA